MAKILQVIFAIYCLVEIISPWPVQGEIISPWPIQHNTTLELKRLNKSLSDVCGPIKASNKKCGRFPIIEAFRSSENTSEMCSSYKRIFGEVVCALNISHNCGNDKNVKELQTAASRLSRGSNVNCSDREGTATTRMGTFCLALQSYVNRIIPTCLNGTKKEKREITFLRLK